MLKALGRDVASGTTWSILDTELHGEAADVVDRTPRVHKLPHYSLIHECVTIRTRPIRMLEIGSFYGDSLEMWQGYLHPDSRIVMIDIDSKLVKIADSGSVHVRLGGDQNYSLLRDLAAEFGPFDLIIDAGSQSSSRMVSSFRSLFGNAMSEGGVYILGDVYCDFWTLYNSFSFTDAVTALLDAVRGHYQLETDLVDFRGGHLLVARRATRDLRERSSSPL